MTLLDAMKALLAADIASTGASSAHESAINGAAGAPLRGFAAVASRTEGALSHPAQRHGGQVLTPTAPLDHELDDSTRPSSDERVRAGDRGGR
jgi:orotate phosphoribosyltransferase